MGSEEDRLRIEAEHAALHADRFWSKVNKSDHCWEWTAGIFTETGYGLFRIDRSIQPRGAHRVSWMLAHGPIPVGMSVLHRCDNRPCVRPSHLFLGTQFDNMEDMRAKRRGALGERNGAHTHPERRPRGEACGGARLAEKDAIAIIELACNGKTHLEIAKLFCVARSTVGAIVRGDNWLHLARLHGAA